MTAPAPHGGQTEGVWRCARCGKSPETHAVSDCLYEPTLMERHGETGEREDPRRAAMTAVRNMAADWYCPFDDERQRIDCPECVAAVALDAYEGVQRLDYGITS